MSLIGRTQEEFYTDVIKERARFAEQVESYAYTFDKLLHQISEYSSNYYTTTVAWIGGSRTWNKTLNTVFPGFISRLDKVSVSAVTPGNYDMFFLCNSPKLIESAVCDINDKIVNAVKKLNLLHGIKCTIERRNLKVKPECNIKYSDDYCTLFPCSSISMFLSEKLLFYIEFALVENLDTVEFRNAFLIMPSSDHVYYLNISGLAFFLEYIKVSRKDKVINIDRVREEILYQLKEYMPSKSLIANIYHSLFYNTKYYDSSFMNMMMFKHVNALYYNNVLEDNIQMYIIKKTRPMINMFIQNLSDILDSTYKKRAFIFIVGGDAIRRYDKNLVETKDIDAKLYYNRNGMFKALKDTLINEMCQFAVFMSIVYNGLLKDKHYGHASVKFQNNTDVSPYYLRMIKAGKDFPVDLFSVDYRYIIKVRVNGQLYEVKKTLPILDIVLQKSNKEKNEVATEISGINIASLNFLISDITYTYSHRNLAQGRFWSGKNIQDKRRLEALIHQMMHGMEIDHDNELSVTSDVTEYSDPRLIELGSQYRKLYKNYISKHPRLSKYKLRFALGIEEKNESNSDGIYIKKVT